MSSKKAYNLVLVNSFPTNSIILKGAIAFLSDYFNVYPIDLPGFRKDIPPLTKISIRSYAEYVEREVEKLNLDKYMMGGVSFGHCVVSAMNLDDHCRAVLSFEPYVNDHSLLMSRKDREFDRKFVWFMLHSRLYRLLWNKLALSMFFKFHHQDIVDIILEEVNPRTFFETALLLVSHHRACWTDKPYILLANRDDDRVCYHTNLEEFKAKTKKLLVIDEQAEHFPNDISKRYFARHINPESIKRVMDWLEKVY